MRNPKQTRGKQTKSKIINAAFELFSEKGYTGTSSNEIASRAEVAIGSFYSYFKDKKQLFIEVLKDYYDNISKISFSNINGTISNLDDFLYESIKIALKAHEYHPEFHREVNIMELADDDIKKLIVGYEKVKFDSFKKLVEPYKNEFKNLNFNEALFLIYTTIENTVHVITFSTDTNLNKETLIKELISMIKSYINA
ncbi:AcrR family transcriptional regulator [Clostridium acetobutylicum]|uniref:Transcriptional regulator, AcrR family n=1 Tax=Clostridium acetobutylicum (strain ATCC 824 / DSM 792 / JCM 1419 / IAM 19013 / LMG 5710 / NBRC 13948 / NRRL B-527 / VKM B-1787 / 2291 / W) TaxID=272562 RepID=Q97D02_CLOAB|nr:MULTISPECIES: TetR/AcrR family transcriptional regulator [Clostridium]AAK81608.1 Transcriptional regulator, AcrR family [Clostridium acetobutylicum ATCC 824]ADZ22731.1 Transcriptional regulator, AcrR family [Clostridium acetobutylicum EA 2018]AEI34691.1 AcrR family transcriptional regulator [Clostridium acetobutylicum DSM 1731]AWV80717.1 TetR/AcrR family transcriptional regulator [Clostridium acetobutylicum]MBC2393959.1 TetR/AcrR family transcriptional regulator [Clostridium acetobutylicum]